MTDPYASQAIRLMRRAILLTLMGHYAHARGQVAAARGNIILAHVHHSVRKHARNA